MGFDAVLKSRSSRGLHGAFALRVICAAAWREIDSLRDYNPWAILCRVASSLQISRSNEDK